MFDELMGEIVVLDMISLYVYVGRLIEEDQRYVVLQDVDVHDLRDSSTNREIYVREIRLHGVEPNRKRVLVQQDQIVGVSRLADVNV